MSDDIDTRTLARVNSQRIDAVEQRLNVCDKSIENIRSDLRDKDAVLAKHALDIAAAAGFTGSFKFVGGIMLAALLTALVAAFGSLIHLDLSQQVSNPPAATRHHP